MSNANAIVLELPGKGAYAPNKFGCRHGDFMKTNVEGQKSPMWIFNSRIFKLSNPKDIEDFNALSEALIPHCYSRQMRIIPRFIHIPSAEAPIQAPEPAKKTAKKKVSTAQQFSALVPPPLTPPPSRGSE